MLSLTCFLDVDLADVLELPDGDVQGAECACPPYSGAAVDNNGRPQGVASPGGGHGAHQLSLLLPHTLEYCAFIMYCIVMSCLFIEELDEIETTTLFFRTKVLIRYGSQLSIMIR